MFTSATAPADLTAAFAPISLAELNAKADMLRRLDNKYVVDRATIAEAVPRFAEHFTVLEIDGRRDFTYETCYFDSPELGCYTDHHRGRRQRAKVRIRNYVESGLCYLEVKLKDIRGITIKKRLAHDLPLFGRLDGRAHAFVEDCYRGLYGNSFPHQLGRMLDMRYRRMTLVAKSGGERMTIDNGIVFWGSGAERPVDQDVFIVETKSANGNGIADKILRSLHCHPVKHCSKYCAGTAMLNTGLKANNFRTALRKLESMTNSDWPVMGSLPVPAAHAARSSSLALAFA